MKNKRSVNSGALPEDDFLALKLGIIERLSGPFVFSTPEEDEAFAGIEKAGLHRVRGPQQTIRNERLRSPDSSLGLLRSAFWLGS